MNPLLSLRRLIQILLAGILTITATGWLPASIQQGIGFLDTASASALEGCDLYTWGSNEYGLLADGRILLSPTPVQVTGIGPVSNISAGANSALILESSGTPGAGTLRTWGYATALKADGNSLDARSEPFAVMTVDGVKALVKGWYSSFVLKVDGTVWSWGVNYAGSLGDGTTTSRFTPQPIPGLTGVKQLSEGYWHFLALKQDGTVWSWGPNGFGQLGDGTTTNRTAPVQVTGISDYTIKAVSGGLEHSLALTDTGLVLAWGNNTNGALGDGTTTSRGTPAPVSGLDGVIAISAGSAHSLALKNDGTVWAWGNNNGSAPGSFEGNYSTLPVKVQGISDVSAIAASTFYSLALKNDGTVWAWGSNKFGELGDGTYENSRPMPVQVVGLFGVTDIAGGGTFSLALKNDGTIWTWGNNSYGELGDGSALRRLVPAASPYLQNVTSASRGYHTARATKADGTTWAWGKNDFGTVEAFPPFHDENGALRAVPVKVTDHDDYIQVSSQYGFHLALKADGTVWVWGGRYLADFDYWISYPLYQVEGLSDVQAVSAGYDHMLALKNDGTVWSWGRNNYGQLGDGTTTGRENPVQVVGLSGVKAITTGIQANAVIKQDGTVWTWGSNMSGVLGDRSWSDRHTPVQVADLTGIVSISMGRQVLALKNDGTVWAWGFNQQGQLGVEGYAPNAPILVPGLSDITGVAVGEDASFARQADGTLWAWGRNIDGQLGDGTTTDRKPPQPVLRWTCAGSFGPGMALVQVDPAPYAYRQSLTGEEDQPLSFQLQAAAKNNPPLTYTITDGPDHGTLSGKAPNLVYQPAADYFGTDHFAFTVSDGRQTSAPAEVTITVSNTADAPRVAGIAPIVAVRGSTVRLTINAVDPDGDPLMYYFGTGEGLATLDGETGAFEWNIQSNEALGTYYFLVYVSDNSDPLHTTQVTFNIQVVNSLPLYLPFMSRQR